MREKRVIWVPYGYRLKRRYRAKLSKANRKKDQTVTEKKAAPDAISVQPVSMPQKAENNSRGVVDNQAIKNTGTVASFDASFNPYHAYVNDMMTCLTSIPKESFVVGQNAAPEDIKLADNPSEQEEQGKKEENAEPPSNANTITYPQPNLAKLTGIAPCLLAGNRQ